MSTAAAADSQEQTPTAVTALDWVVILAATAALVVLLVWAYQGKRPPADEVPS